MFLWVASFHVHWQNIALYSSWDYIISKGMFLCVLTLWVNGLGFWLTGLFFFCSLRLTWSLLQCLLKDLTRVRQGQFEKAIYRGLVYIDGQFAVRSFDDVNLLESLNFYFPWVCQKEVLFLFFCQDLWKEAFFFFFHILHGGWLTSG